MEFLWDKEIKFKKSKC